MADDSHEGKEVTKKDEIEESKNQEPTQPQAIDAEEYVPKSKGANQQITETFVGMMMQSGIPNMASKMTPANIDKAIEVSDKKSQRDFEYSKRDQWFKLVYLVIAVIVLFGLIFILGSDSDMLKEILKAIVFIIAGGLGGYGYAKKSK